MHIRCYNLTLIRSRLERLKVKSVDIQEAQAGLPRLVEEAASGKPFVIAKAGEPPVKAVSMERGAHDVSRRIGGLESLSALVTAYGSFSDGELRSQFEDGPLFPNKAKLPDRSRTRFSTRTSCPGP